jgi:hypothetical protein
MQHSVQCAVQRTAQHTRRNPHRHATHSPPFAPRLIQPIDGMQPPASLCLRHSAARSGATTAGCYPCVRTMRYSSALRAHRFISTSEAVSEELSGASVSHLSAPRVMLHGSCHAIVRHVATNEFSRVCVSPCCRSEYSRSHRSRAKERRGLRIPLHGVRCILHVALGRPLVAG